MTKRPNGLYDLAFVQGDFVLTNSLQNCVLISLACWSRDQDVREVANIKPDVGGWWGNSLEDVEIGSQIWKLFRQKLNSQTAENAVESAKSALKWMIDDGVAKDVSVEAEIKGKYLEMVVSIEKPDATGEEFRWQINWEESL